MNLAKLPPLFFGRLTRGLAGAATLYLALRVARAEPVDWPWAALLGFLGVSFLVGGWVGNPGCEITALPNLVLPADKRLHCV